MRRERSGGDDGRHTPGTMDATGELRARAEPGLEEGGAIARDLAAEGRRHHHRHIRQAALHRSKPDVAHLSLDMHLAPIGDVAEPFVVRDERDAARPPVAGVRNAEPARHHGAQAVGADDERRRQFARRSARLEHPHAGDAPARITREVCHAHSLAKLRARGLCAVEQDGIKHDAPEGQSTIAERAVAVPGDKITAERRAIRCAHDHAVEMRRAGCLHGIQRTHLAQQSRRLGTQVLGAWLRAWKRGAVQHEHARTPA